MLSQTASAQLSTLMTGVLCQAANMVATLDKAEVEARLANQHKAEHSSVSELPALDLKALKQAAEVWSNLAIIDKVFCRMPLSACAS